MIWGLDLVDMVQFSLLPNVTHFFVNTNYVKRYRKQQKGKKYTLSTQYLRGCIGYFIE